MIYSDIEATVKVANGETFQDASVLYNKIGWVLIEHGMEEVGPSSWKCATIQEDSFKGMIETIQMINHTGRATATVEFKFSGSGKRISRRYMLNWNK